MLPVDLRTVDLLRLLSHVRQTVDLLSITSLLSLTLRRPPGRRRRIVESNVSANGALHLWQRGSGLQRAHNDDAVRMPQLMQRVDEDGERSVGAGHWYCAVLVLALLASVNSVNYLATVVWTVTVAIQTPDVNMLKLAANDTSLTTLRAAANRNYVVPHTNRRFGDGAFSVAALKAWNGLPTDLKTATGSADAFKRCLETWVFKRAYD